MRGSSFFQQAAFCACFPAAVLSFSDAEKRYRQAWLQRAGVPSKMSYTGIDHGQCLSADAILRRLGRHFIILAAVQSEPSCRCASRNNSTTGAATP
jgi:hypothetical protein